MKNKKIFVFDVIVTVFIIVFSLSLYFFIPKAENTLEFEVFIDGEPAFTAALSENKSYPLLGGKYVITVENGRACTTLTDCRDKSCTLSEITENGGSIICLPNKVVAMAKKSDSNGVLVAG